MAILAKAQRLAGLRRFVRLYAAARLPPRLVRPPHRRHRGTRAGDPPATDSNDWLAAALEAEGFGLLNDDVVPVG